MPKRPQLPDYDQITGFRFHISLRPDVPDDIRAHDHEFHPGSFEALPDYGNTRYGIWLHDHKSANAQK